MQSLFVATKIIDWFVSARIQGESKGIKQVFTFEFPIAMKGNRFTYLMAL